MNRIGRRSKERTVREAKECVTLWRQFFELGYIDQAAGNHVKCSLLEAAEMVGVPKKTLEDYHSVLRKASEIVNLDEVLEMKMGYLRNLIRERKHIPVQQHEMAPELPIPSQHQMEWEDMVIEGEWEEAAQCEDYGRPQQFESAFQYQMNDDTTDALFEAHYPGNNYFTYDHYFDYRPRSISRNSAGVQEEIEFNQPFDDQCYAAPQDSD